jgi:hypothetical protein
MAGILLDMVFGIPNMFNSCVAQGIQCTNAEGMPIGASVAGAQWMFEPGGALPMPIHQGMHQVLQLYSLGLLVVAAMITAYFIATIVLETAESGTPFGKRFNKVWAPVRLVVAFGLLIPIGYGLNSSQYLVLFAAKFGSIFATNAWLTFNDTLSSGGGTISNLLADRDTTAERLVAQPGPPEIGALLQFVFVAKTCAEMENAILGIDESNAQSVRPFLVREQTAADFRIDFVGLDDPTYDQMIAFTATGTPAGGGVGAGGGAAGAGGTPHDSQVIIRFGRHNDAAYSHLLGNVAPICGDLTMPLADPRDPGIAEVGVEAMQRYYWYIIQELWYNVLPTGAIPLGAPASSNYPLAFFQKWHGSQSSATAILPTNEFKQEIQDFYSRDLRNAMNDPGSSNLGGIINTNAGAIREMGLSGRWQVDAAVRNKGWAGAAIWINRIAEMNGTMTSAVLNIPMPSRYPEVMEAVYLQKRKYDENTTFADRFDPEKGNDAAIQDDKTGDGKKALVLWKAFDYWQQGDSTTTPHSAPTGNAVMDIINSLLGTSGLFDMRRNADVHPIAQLAGLGRSMIEGSIRNLTYAAIGGISGAGLAALSENFFGAAAASVSSLLVTFAMIGLTVGFILFYVVPLLPFIYFFFALSGWVKAIFEAMVGAPLWALAHIRIDGNGLAGQAALSGYFLIFEIFLRPILMVFGLIASVSIFSAVVSVLNQVFDLVVHNLAGFDVDQEFTKKGGITPNNQSWASEMRGPIDEFFFTVIYAIIVYMMGMSCFKLVDQIPNNILRWMGQSVSTFNDGKEDMGQQLVSTTSVGSQQTMSALGGGLQSIARAGVPK